MVIFIPPEISLHFTENRHLKLGGFLSICAWLFDPPRFVAFSFPTSFFAPLQPRQAPHPEEQHPSRPTPSTPSQPPSRAPEPRGSGAARSPDRGSPTDRSLLGIEDPHVVQRRALRGSRQRLTWRRAFRLVGQTEGGRTRRSQRNTKRDRGSKGGDLCFLGGCGVQFMAPTCSTFR